jgi:hypothetical protein
VDWVDEMARHRTLVRATEIKITTLPREGRGFERSQHPAATDGSLGPTAIPEEGFAVFTHSRCAVGRRRDHVDTSDR